MAHAATKNQIVEAERKLLRALCQGTLGASQRAATVKALSNHAFEDRVHQIVFDALREIPSANAQVIREELPSRLNNKGFPDLDWETFFESHNLTPPEAAALVLELAGRSGRRQPRPGRR